MMSAPGPQGDEPHKSPTVVVEDMGRDQRYKPDHRLQAQREAVCIIVLCRLDGC